jgi:glycine/D-amino acid oxidase-like deaminating enzyme
MSPLLVVGAGLFGSLAARYARSKGIETQVFDPGLAGAASPAAAGLFQEAWVGRKLHEHYHQAVPLLERLCGIRQIVLERDDGAPETLLCVPPSAILETKPIRQRVTAVGDGWLEAGGERFRGYVYVAAGVWCRDFRPELQLIGKAGAAFSFAGERPGQLRPLSRGRQAIAFVRDPGSTHFSDGTAESVYTDEHEQQSLSRAKEFGLEKPIRRYWGYRPYTPGGPVFMRLGERLWLGTGGRKMGTILAASFARRLVDEELS